MSACAKQIEWAGGKHVFDLGEAKVRAVLAEERAKYFGRTSQGVLDLRPLVGQFGETPAACLRRFEENVYSLADVERVILYGLWGGGLSFAAADDLVEQHVRGKPLAPNAPVAFAVLSSLFVGAE